MCSGLLSGKVLTFTQRGPGLNSCWAEQDWALVPDQTATFVGRETTPVIPASETQPALPKVREWLVVVMGVKSLVLYMSK